MNENEAVPAITPEEEEFEETMDRIEKLEKGMTDIQNQLNEIMLEAKKRGVVLYVPQSKTCSPIKEVKKL